MLVNCHVFDRIVNSTMMEVILIFCFLFCFRLSWNVVDLVLVLVFVVFVGDKKFSLSLKVW